MKDRQESSNESKWRAYTNLEPDEMRLGVALSDAFQPESRVRRDLERASRGHLTRLHQERGRARARPRESSPRREIGLRLRAEDHVRRRGRFRCLRVRICRVFQKHRFKTTVTRAPSHWQRREIAPNIVKTRAKNTQLSVFEISVKRS